MSKREAESRWVHSITDEDGHVYKTNDQIAARFADYYAAFYKARPLSDSSNIDSYLKAVDLPQLTPEDALELEREITLDEVQAAI